MRHCQTGPVCCRITPWNRRTTLYHPNWGSPIQRRMHTASVGWRRRHELPCLDRAPLTPLPPPTLRASRRSDGSVAAVRPLALSPTVASWSPPHGGLPAVTLPLRFLSHRGAASFAQGGTDESRHVAQRHHGNMCRLPGVSPK